MDVIRGNGPCNVDRLSARKKAWDDGEWVRDGLLAHARKKASAKVALTSLAAMPVHSRQLTI